jgi:hypothetical protein
MAPHTNIIIAGIPYITIEKTYNTFVSKAMPSSVENSSTHIINAIDIRNFIEHTDLFKSVFK